MKKIFAFLLSITMILSMGTLVFAESGTNDNSGKITIQNPKIEETYSIYQIFILESYNNNDGEKAYAYTIQSGSDWWNFVKPASSEGDEAGAGNAYVELDKFTTDASGVTTYYVTWNSAKSAADDIATFAKLALTYAYENNIDAIKIGKIQESDGTKKLDTTGSSSDNVSYDSKENTLIFSNLNLGYYLVNSTLGTVCILDTTNPNATVQEKNAEPTVDKKVWEDSKIGQDNEYGDENTAQIGDIVYFKTTINAKKGARNYVLHDVMSDGLTLNEDSIKVYRSSINDANEVSATTSEDETIVTNYTVKTGNNVSETTDPKCTFEIEFQQSYLDTITEDTEIIVTYTAVLNEKAVIYSEANTNKTKLSYGDSSSTTEVETKTYTFKFDIVKTDSSYNLLDGAQYELYDSENDGTKINLVAVDSNDDGDADFYRVATEDEYSAEGFTSAVIKAKNGKATVIGMDADTIYWLKEIKAPEGYNILNSRVKVEIKNDNLTTTMDADETTWTNEKGGVNIVNNTGTELPSTGGIGTTIFYIAGSLLVAGAIVFFVVRRRMNSEKTD